MNTVEPHYYGHHVGLGKGGFIEEVTVLQGVFALWDTIWDCARVTIIVR